MDEFLRLIIVIGLVLLFRGKCADLWRTAFPARMVTIVASPSSNQHQPIVNPILNPVAVPKPPLEFTTLASTKGDFSQLKDFRDGFTGEILNPALGVYKCVCEIHYHAESYRALVVMNDGACLSCGKKTITCLLESLITEWNELNAE